MPTDIFHGVRVFQSADEPVIVNPVGTSTLGVMLAVDPADLPAGVTVNTPIAIRNANDAAGLPDDVQATLSTVWDQGGGQVILTFIDEGADAAAKTANAVGSAVNKTGVHAFTKAASLGLRVPKLLCFPGVTKAPATGDADAVIAAAITVAEDLRAQVYVDGPNTTLEDAKLAVPLIGGQKRVCVCDPFVTKSIGGTPTAVPSSIMFAAAQSAMDLRNNVSWPATNVLARGIIGVNRPTDYASEATDLNEAGVNTIINKGDGLRLWGPVTAAAITAGTIWKFVNVVRAADFINESIENAFSLFVGRPMTTTHLDLAVLAGKHALKDAESEGIILPGARFGLASNNTATQGAQGIVKFGMQYEVPAPIYDLRITAYRNILAYDLLFESVSGQFSIAEAA